ncbi:MAG: TonB-dependent receptor [Lentisphaeraceae bacterium]|nr:TonB-dependent receptor [Lentisphaeraceae bacterium]
MKLNFLNKLLLSGGILCALNMSALSAEEKTTEPAQKEHVIVNGDLNRITPEGGTVLHGSSVRLNEEDLKNHSYADINRILRKVPGVYLREEDGFGLFPNIAMRGINSHRSAKITIMEDGIMAAPAPYSAPEAYYSPNAARMSAIEVIKGASSIKYGPHTVGGVVNYLSTPIPLESTFYLKQLFGSFDEARTHAYWGDTFELEAGRLGVLLEYYDRQNDGFKDIQNSSQDTGIAHQREPMLKLSFEPNSSMYQLFEFKLAYSDMRANETYTGLEREDFKSDPYDRYWGTQFDQINTNAVRSYLKHYVELSDESSLKTTLYYQKFHRNWRKLSGTNLDVIQGVGAAGSTLQLKNNNRDYNSYGVKTEYKHSLDIAGIEHNLTLGARYHIDSYEDNSWYDKYTVDGTTITDFTSGKSTAARGQLRDSHALSYYLEDAIAVTDKLTITPGVRLETITYQYDKRDGSGRHSSNTSIWIPGVGFSYEINNDLQLFGGVHKGISTPTPNDDIAGTSHQKSLSYELGLRYNKETYGGEAVLFFNDMEDIYDPKSEASGASEGRNIGDAETWGVELSAFYDAGAANDWGFSNPWYVSATYTKAELTKLNTDSKGINGFFENAGPGTDMPYIPEWQAAIGTGIHFDKCGIDINASFVGETFTTGGNTDDNKLDSHLVVDMSAYYQINKNIKLVANVHNLLDEVYEAAQHPDYIRAGKPLSATVGFEVKF